jgi:hypothetical protein
MTMIMGNLLCIFGGWLLGKALLRGAAERAAEDLQAQREHQRERANAWRKVAEDSLRELCEMKGAKK